MLQKSTIRTYFTVLALQTMLGTMFLLPALGHATRCHKYPVFYIVHATDGVHVYAEPRDEDAINEWFQDPTLIDMGCVTLYPYSEVGPLKGVLEFYQRESFLSSPDDFRWSILDMDLSVSEIQLIHTELIRFAKDDSYLSRFRPGAPKKIEFLPAETLFSIIKVGSYFGFPALVTWLTGYLKIHSNKAITQGRYLKGLCIHCAYDCTGIPSTTCPECGQPHTIPIAPPILKSNA